MVLCLLYFYKVFLVLYSIIGDSFNYEFNNDFLDMWNCLKYEIYEFIIDNFFCCFLLF